MSSDHDCIPDDILDRENLDEVKDDDVRPDAERIMSFRTNKGVVMHLFDAYGCYFGVTVDKKNHPVLLFCPFYADSGAPLHNRFTGIDIVEVTNVEDGNELIPLINRFFYTNFTAANFPGR